MNRSLRISRTGIFPIILTGVVLFLTPSIGHCSVESTLGNMQSALIGRILPLVAILGLAFAGLSFVAGSQNARAHLTLAVIGAVIGFGAPSIVAFIRTIVQ